MKNQLIILTRYPQAGLAKTRLIPALGANGAAQLHQQLTTHLLANLTDFQRQDTCHMTLYYSGATQIAMKQWLGDQYHFQPQANGDLGIKMYQAFAKTVKPGDHSAIIIGTDCPSIDSTVIKHAFSVLKKYDLCIGPAFDGGYYLLGLSLKHGLTRFLPLFQNINWGTDQVYQQTINKLRQITLNPFILAHRHDIDRPEDLCHFNYHPNP